jgi:membrane complex biogenesis BtpA family protein
VTSLAPLLHRGGSTLVGVVHLGALPGAPRFRGDLAPVLQAAEADARALADGGADALIVENFGDAPFFATAVPPETIAAMTLAVHAVQQAAPGLPVGVNVLRNDAAAALGIAAATGAAFVRINVHTGAMVTDQGIIEGRAAETVRLRERLCPGLPLLCDVHVKHAVPLGGGDLAVAARDTWHRGLAAALIVSGTGTGTGVDPADLDTVRAAVPEAPVWIGSGLTLESLPVLGSRCDGAIVGTTLKHGGSVDAPVDAGRVRALRGAWSRA